MINSSTSFQIAAIQVSVALKNYQLKKLAVIVTVSEMCLLV